MKFVDPEVVASAMATPPSMPEGIAASDLKGTVFPPIAWVMNNLIAGGLTMLAGKPKIGKSWLVLDIAVAVASGGYALDRKCAQGDVLYAALEDNQRRLKARMDQMCSLREWPARLTFWTKMERLEQGGLDQLHGWIASVERPRLIIIDVFSKVRRVRRGQEGIYDADYLSAVPLKALADETGVAIVVVHHLRKAKDSADPLDGVSGSTGLTGACDTILVLDRGGEGGVTLFATGRDVERIELALKFDSRGCRWSDLGDAREVRMSDQRRAIIEALRGEPEPVGPNDIAVITGQKHGNVRRLLGQMARADEVQKVGRGKYTLPNAPREHR